MKSRKQRSKGTILAGGGIVVRHGARPLIAIVQRRKDGRWVLPRGKLKLRENAKAGAKREAVEETGQRVDVHEFLGAIVYKSNGKPKVTHFWRMQARDSAPRKPMRDIKAVEWLPLGEALEALSQPLERSFLLAVSRRVLKAMRPRRHPNKQRKSRPHVRSRGVRRKRQASPTLLRRIFRV